MAAEAVADPVDWVRGFVDAVCSEGGRGPLYIFVQQPPDAALAAVLGWVTVDRRLQPTVVAPENTLASRAQLEQLRAAGAAALYVTLAGARQQDELAGTWRRTMRVLLTAAQAIPRVRLGAHFVLSPESADSLPRALELLRRAGNIELLLWDGGCSGFDGVGLPPTAALRALDFAVTNARKLGVRIRALGFERTRSADAGGSAEPTVADGTIVELLREGIRLPSAAGGLLAANGNAAPIREAAATGYAAHQLAAELAARGHPVLDLPTCLGGGPLEASRTGVGVKVEACRRCPIEPRCGGLPRALMAIPGITEEMQPPLHWMPMSDQVRAVVLCTPASDLLYGGTFFSMARWLARLGARVDVVTPWDTLPGISATSTEVQRMGCPDGPTEVEKFMVDGAVEDYDLIVTPDPKVTHPLVVQRRLRPGTRLAITDFHMLGGMEMWVRDLRVPGRRPEEGGWWPSDQITLYSAFPGYAPLYLRYGIPMRQVAWQPYVLNPELFSSEVAAVEGETIISAGHHRRDLQTLLAAAALLGSGVHRIELFASVDVPGVPPQIRFRGSVPPEVFCPEAARSRFMVVPLLADPYNAAGITAFVTAMMCGRPVISSDTAGARDYIFDGVNGLLVPPSDPRALAEAIERLDTDAALLAKLAEGARRAAAHHTTETWARALLRGTRNYDAEHWVWSKWRGRSTPAAAETQPSVAEVGSTDRRRALLVNADADDFVYAFQFGRSVERRCFERGLVVDRITVNPTKGRDLAAELGGAIPPPLGGGTEIVVDSERDEAALRSALQRLSGRSYEVVVANVRPPLFHDLLAGGFLAAPTLLWDRHLHGGLRAEGDRRGVDPRLLGKLPIEVWSLDRKTGPFQQPSLVEAGLEQGTGRVWPLDLEFFQSTLAQGPDRVFAGGENQRDWPLFLEAVRDLPLDVHVVSRQVPAERPSNVRVEARLPLSRFRDALAAASIFVVPLVADAAAGVTVIPMAMALGVAVVATRTPWTEPLIDDGESGLLVPPGDAGALRAAIVRLRDEPSLREHLVANARRKVAALCDLEAFTREMFATLDR